MIAPHMVGHNYGNNRFEPPDLSLVALAAANVPVVDPTEFAAALLNLAPRRRSLYRFVATEGFPPEVDENSVNANKAEGPYP